MVDVDLTAGPLFVYRARVRAGELNADPAQELLAEKLQSLHRALTGYVQESGHAGWKERFGLTRRRAEPPQGLYIFGGVGRGKSMLMDLFFDAAPVADKRRAHFHEFLQDVHARFNAYRDHENGEGDPIPAVATAIAKEAALLCFDEFQVSNIVDAMILGRLFEQLFAHDVVVVATSNRPPQDLYKDGLQRDRFLPFIGMIVEKLDLLELESARDYRLERMRGMQVYYAPADRAAQAALAGCFAELANGRPAETEHVEIKGRTLEIPAADGVAMTDFDFLCAQPLGPADYLAIADRYHALILENIPIMPPRLRNEARRFVTLIDALYERKVNLICSADVEARELYPEGEGAFEFERLVSRLIEMQSVLYCRRPCDGVSGPRILRSMRIATY